MNINVKYTSKCSQAYSYGLCNSTTDFGFNKL